MEAGHRLVLQALPGSLAVVQLAVGAEVPSWAWNGTFAAVVRTPDELSIVCDQNMVPEGVRAERDWVGLRVQGPFSFSQTGILASLVGPLAADSVSVVVVSTFDTDYILVKTDRLQRVRELLQAEGHFVG